MEYQIMGEAVRAQLVGIVKSSNSFMNFKERRRKYQSIYFNDAGKFDVKSTSRRQRYQIAQINSKL